MRFVGDLSHLLRGRRFRQLFAVRVTSQAGDGVFQVALASYVLFSPERQPDALAIAGVLAAVLLPFSVLGPLVGVFLDRWSRRQILVTANVVRLAPVALVAGLIATGVSGIGLYAVVLVAFSINRFFLAGLSASLPHVVTRDDLVLANAVTPTAGTMAFLVGLGVASLLRPLLPGIHADSWTVAFSGIVYATAAVLAARIPRDLLGPDLDPTQPEVLAALQGVITGLVAGLRHLQERRTAAHALAVIASHRFFYGLSTVATILLYRNYFHDSSDTDAALAGLAVAVLVSGVGFLAAAVITPLATARMSPEGWIVVLLVLAAVVEVVPGALYTEPALLVAALALGLSAQGVKICVDTLVQTAVDDPFRGRVFALYDVVFNVVFVAAAAVAAVVIPMSGKSYPLVVAIAAGYALTAAAYAHLTAGIRPSAHP